MEACSIPAFFPATCHTQTGPSGSGRAGASSASKGKGLFAILPLKEGVTLGFKGTAAAAVAALLVLAATAVWGQQNGQAEFRPGPVAVWQGFTLSWTYNHRLNRLGNYVVSEPRGDGIQATVVQTAATGLGDDIGRYDGRFSAVNAPGLLWAQKSVRFHLRARRGEPSTLSAEVSAPDPRPGQRLRALAFLNGFDLQARGRADKLQTLELSVGEPFRDRAAGELRAVLTATLNLDCRSLECSKLRADYDYALTVEVLLVMVPEALSAASEVPVTDAYSWDRHTELRRPPLDRTASGTGEGVYRQAVLGLCTLSLRLAQDSWFIDWATAIAPGRYDPAAGTMPFQAQLLFREWRTGMRRYSADPFDSRFSFRRPGSAAAACTVLMLQIASGCTASRSVEGRIDWPGRNQASDQPEAVQTVSTLLGPDCSLR